MENNFWLIGIIGKILGILEKSFSKISRSFQQLVSKLFRIFLSIIPSK